MKKNYRVLLIVVIILAMIISFSTRKIVNAKVSYNKKVVSQELSDALKEWYTKIHSADFKNITINVFLAKDIQDVKVKDKKVEAIFYVNAKMVQYVIKSPFLKGMQKYLDENRAKLTEAQINTVESAIKERRDEFKNVIGKIHEENGTFKVVCGLASEGAIDKKNVEIFYDVSAKGKPIWKDANNLFPPSTPNSNTKEENGYKKAENLIDKLYSSNTSTNQISPDSTYQNFYNGINAAYYADDHTSEAPQSKQITCWINNNPAVSKYTNISYWNNSQYPLTKFHNGYYEQLACNNCADFVSQAMYYGGMQADSYWNPSIRKTGYNGTWCWVNVGDLTDHMKQRGDWIDSSYDSLGYGDVSVLWGYDQYGNIIRKHIVIADYPNYYGYNFFAGHTNDVEFHYYPQSSQWFYYHVSCWRFAP